MRRGIEGFAAGATALTIVTGCGDWEPDNSGSRIPAIDEAARTGIWMAPYGFFYQRTDGEFVETVAAVRPWAEVKGSFECDIVGTSASVDARLFSLEDREDGQHLVEVKQPESDTGLMRRNASIGHKTVNCIKFDEGDRFVQVEFQGTTYELPSVGKFPDGEKRVGQTTDILSDFGSYP